MKTIAAAALAGLAMASTPTQAADLFGTAPPPLSDVPDNPPVEVGSNWYIRGDVGVGLETVPTLSFSSVSTPAQGNGVLPVSSKVGDRQPNFDVDIGFGYRVNNWFRAEATYEYWTGTGGRNNNTYICPYGLTPIPVGANPNQQLGYLYNTSQTCNGSLDIHQQNDTLLVNGFIDLGTWWGITPYVGAGGGLNANNTSGSVAYNETVGGATYNPNLSTTGNVPQIWVDSNGNPLKTQPNISFTQQNWNRSFSNTKYNPAWALMAGFGIRISPSATLDIGYKYLNAGVVSTPITNQVGSVMKQSNTMQEIRIGIRYMTN